MHDMKLKSSGKIATFSKDTKFDRITTCTSSAAVGKFAMDFYQFR
jgi:hypothetical protein